MTRDKGLEALINDELDSISGLTEKAMFGGLGVAPPRQPALRCPR